MDIYCFKKCRADINFQTSFWNSKFCFRMLTVLIKDTFPFVQTKILHLVSLLLIFSRYLPTDCLYAHVVIANNTYSLNLNFDWTEEKDIIHSTNDNHKEPYSLKMIFSISSLLLLWERQVHPDLLQQKKSSLSVLIYTVTNMHNFFFEDHCLNCCSDRCKSTYCTLSFQKILDKSKELSCLHDECIELKCYIVCHLQCHREITKTLKKQVQKTYSCVVYTL